MSTFSSIYSMMEPTTMADLLKKHRKSLHIDSDEVIAEKIKTIAEGTNKRRAANGKPRRKNIVLIAATIKNWESGATVPDIIFWEGIVKVYGIGLMDFWCTFWESQIMPEDEFVEIPSCLFSDKAFSNVQQLVFSPQETEMIRMLYIHNENWKVSKVTMCKNSRDICEILKKLPQEYINSIGIDVAIKLVCEVHSKICNDEMQKLIVDELMISKEDIMIEAFNIFHESFYFILRMAGLPSQVHKGDTNIFSIFLLHAIKNIMEGHTIVFDENIFSASDLDNKRKQSLMKYIQNFAERIHERPESIVSPEIMKEFQFYSEKVKSLLDEKRKCFLDGWDLIIQGHENHCDVTRTSEETFFYEVFVMDCEPYSPFNDWITFNATKENGKWRCTASLTEKGMELYKFSLKNELLKQEMERRF